MPRDLYGGRTAIATCLAVVAVAAPLAAAAEAQQLQPCPTPPATEYTGTDDAAAELRQARAAQAEACSAIADRLDRLTTQSAEHAAHAHDDVQPVPTPPAVQKVQLEGAGTEDNPLFVSGDTSGAGPQMVALTAEDSTQLFSIRWGVMAILAAVLVAGLLSPILRRIWLP